MRPRFEPPIAFGLVASVFVIGGARAARLGLQPNEPSCPRQGAWQRALHGEICRTGGARGGAHAVQTPMDEIPMGEMGIAGGNCREGR